MVAKLYEALDTLLNELGKLGFDLTEKVRVRRQPDAVKGTSDIFHGTLVDDQKITAKRIRFLQKSKPQCVRVCNYSLHLIKLADLLV